MHSEYVPNEYTIWWDGKPVSEINRHLLKKQGVEHNRQVIIDLHVQKLYIYSQILATNSKFELKEFANTLTTIEFKLQDAWGFPRCSYFHRFWETPKCLCPRMDNEDNYPHGYYTKMSDCPLHGWETNE